jgi:hypothetical protein
MITKPEILCQPNIPKALHGISPRTINGNAWWERIRRETYRKTDYHCMACGKAKKDTQRLDAHEWYNIDYEKGIMTIKDIVPLCYECHNFIHSGRLKTVYRNGEIAKDQCIKILKNGFDILIKNNLKCFPGTFDFAFLLNIIPSIKCYEINDSIPWEKWKFIFNGKEYHSKFKNKEEWKNFYNKKEDMMERPQTPVKSDYTKIIRSEDRSKPVLIIGKSGAGKSTSIRTLPPKNTFLLNVIGKALPFRGWRKNYVEGKNMLSSDNYAEITQALKGLKKEVQYIVLDDAQYLMAGEFMSRAYEKGYDKWNELGKHFYDLLMDLNGLGQGRVAFVLAHSDTNESGETDVKTLGKMLSDKIVVAGLFTVVLQCVVEKGNYYFETKSENGKSVVKAPHEMFKERLIKNDLKAVADAIQKYENE